MEWFKDGERNTKFFHTIVKGRRSRLKINRTQNQKGIWIEDQESIAADAVKFFQQQFAKGQENTNFEILNELPTIISKQQNEKMHKIPDMIEVKHAVMGQSRNSAEGPDGMTGAFFQDAWKIISQYIHNMVVASFCDCELPKFVTHTNLLLLPKKLVVNTFSDMRPISLSNFLNKILSRILHERIKSVLPNITSEEQAGFV